MLRTYCILLRKIYLLVKGEFLTNRGVPKKKKRGEKIIHILVHPLALILKPDTLEQNPQLIQ